MATAVITSPSIEKIQYMDYAPYGASKELFRRREKELVIAGPGGTGKSRACLEKCHWMCEKYPRARGLMVRKTRRSLTQSGIVTFEQKVLPHPSYVPFHTGDQAYRYPNGSIFAVGGLDDANKIFSSEWDFVYAQQAEELGEDDWEKIIFRLRNWVIPYQQVIGDVNPAQPEHWLRVRARLGRMAWLESIHEDNPELWDAKKKCWTVRGLDYISGLDSLTGARYMRYRKGIWASAEGTVYQDSWNKAVHVIDRFVTSDLTKDQVPKDWPRFWVIDFGYTNPFVWQAWAQDPDGRMFRYKEIYHTKRIVEDHAKTILEVTKDEPKPQAIICDHDAEDRATLERHLKMKTIGAYKAVSIGIQSVESRLKIAGDGKPRILYLRDSVIEIDKELAQVHKPVCTEDEYDVYIWDTSNGKKIKEDPKKENDHGQDTTRYMTCFVDKISKAFHNFFGMISVTKSSESGSGGSSDLTRSSGWHMDSSAPSRWGG